MACISANLVRIDGRYYYRQRIPQDLLYITSKKEFKKALGTACPKEARLLSVKIRGVIESYFNKLRTMTDDNVPSLKDAAAAIKEAVAQAKDSYIEQLEIKETLSEVKAVVADAVHKKEKEELAAKAGKLENNVDSLIKQNENTSAALTQVLASGVPQAPKEPEKVAKLYSDYVEMALDDTRANKKPTEHSLEQKRTRMDLFIRIVGDRPITDYERADILKYKAQLEDLPNNFGKSPKDNERTFEQICIRPNPKLSVTTLDKHFREVKSVFDTASREVPINLGMLDKIVLHGEAKQNRKIWTTQHLNDLFKTPIYQGRKGRLHKFTYHKGKNLYKDAYFWLPVIAIFTGMRLEEIAKLRVCDFQMEDGISFIDVNEDIGRLKNKQSIRQVPIHPYLYELGLNDLVKGRKENRVFDELELGGHNGDKWGFAYSEDFTVYRKKTKTYEKMRDFHSFRHTFASKLYDKTQDVITTCAICGHAPDEASDLGNLKDVNVTTTRYIHRDLKASYEAIKKLSYDDVDFSNLLKTGKR